MLRDYQIKAIAEIKAHFKAGRKKVLLWMPTGAGKTVVFSEIMKGVSAKGNQAAMITRGRKLVDQCHKRLLRENVYHGVMMANHWAVNRAAPIQICSVDTLRSRAQYPKADLLVYDEVHYATSQSYIELIEQYPDDFHLGVTATPFTDKSLRHVAEVIVKPITMQELIDQGYLVPPVYYAPTSPDVSKVKVSQSTKDYVVAELEDILNGNDIVGNLVENWKLYGQNRPTLVFAVSVAHSKHIAKTYCDAGIPAEHCDAETPEREREKVLERFVSGETKVITNVGLWCTGVDIPSVGCIQMARPTKSYTLYIQQAGRGTRTSEGKNDFILLDNAGNVLRHGFITDEPEPNLDGKKIKESVIPIKTCPKCFMVFNRFKAQCPACGHKNETTSERIVSETDGTLVRLNEMPLEARAYQEFQRLKKIRKEKKFKRGWIYHRMRIMFGEEIASKYVPKREVPSWVIRK